MPSICFVNPKWQICIDPEFNEFWKKSVTPNLIRNTLSGFGLSILILAALTPAEYEIEIIDENLHQLDFNKNYDLVAITCCTHQATRAYEISKKFRRKNIKTVLGGIHPTVCSDEASKNADSVVVGECEDLWPQLLRDFEAGELKKSGCSILFIGFDSDDAESIRNTCDFIKESNIYAPQISVLTPYPGCALREHLASQNRILNKDWNYYTGQDVTFRPNKMSEKELQRQLVSSLKSIYKREYLENNVRYFKDIFKNN